VRLAGYALLNIDQMSTSKGQHEKKKSKASKNTAKAGGNLTLFESQELG
jgi:hypothetical protein